MVAAAVAGVVGWRLATRPRPELTLRVRVAAPVTVATPDVLTVRPGETVTVEATGASTIWVFRGDALISACPGPTCEYRADGFSLSFTPRAGRHRVVALHAFAPVAPADGFEASVTRARRQGAGLELRSIDAMTPP